jgi:hypothetical protein
MVRPLKREAPQFSEPARMSSRDRARDLTARRPGRRHATAAVTEADTAILLNERGELFGAGAR